MGRYPVRSACIAGHRLLPMLSRCLSVWALKARLLLLMALLTAVIPTARADSELSLALAEQIALERDAVLQASRERSDGLRERSVAAGQLPDPRLKLGMMNLPTDTFERTQEAMTQAQIGVQQMFPRGKSLALRERRTLAMADGEDAKSAEQSARVRRAVRLAWLETYYWIRAADIVEQNRGRFERLVATTRAHYAAGRSNQQDVTRAQLELGLLDDRLIQVRAREEVARAELGKWVGPELARRALSSDWAELSVNDEPGVASERLASHPLMQVEASRVAAEQLDVGLAREAYKPGWMVDVTYGFRGGQDPDGDDRADFLSAMVLVDLPVFRAKRQDRELAASQHELDAALNQREEQHRQLERQWEEARAEWRRLSERVAQYDQLLLPKASENSRAALHAYQTGTGDFTALMRAQISELETQLKALRLRVDRAKAQAKLRYVLGETQ